MNDDTKYQLLQLHHVLTMILRERDVPHAIRCEIGRLRRILQQFGLDDWRENKYTERR